MAQAAPRINCPACSELIEAEVAKCVHCGELLERWRGGAGSREDDAAHLRRVARYQREILVCILVYFVVIGGQWLIPPVAHLGLAIVGFVVVVSATVSVFRLALELYSTGVGVALALLTLVPCVGLLVLMVINSRATERLTSQGIRVGLFGADMSGL